MTGTLINVAAILVGGAIASFLRGAPSGVLEQRLKPWLGAFALYAGGRAIFVGVSGDGFWTALLRGVLLMGGLSVGRVIGRKLGLQNAWNRMGRFAREELQRAHEGAKIPANNAFLAVCAIFCLSPLAVAGPLIEGVSSDLRPLLLKSVLDGVGMLTFVRLLGPGCLIGAIPVLSLQGSLTLAAKLALTWLEAQGLDGAIQATCGFLVLAVTLVIFGMGRVRLADYLPALLVVPALYRLAALI
ncbi:MAG: DUF554 family protein [Verrucomicrobiales bacterium]|nr:DUF554 family protein [Verrucomicrobiales bacterium]